MEEMKGVTRQVQDKLPDNPTSSLRITWIGYFRWFASILYLLKNKRSGGLDTPYQSASFLYYETSSVLWVRYSRWSALMFHAAKI